MKSNLTVLTTTCLVCFELFRSSISEVMEQMEEIMPAHFFPFNPNNRMCSRYINMSGRQKPLLRTQKHHGLCDFQLLNIGVISLACKQIEICRNVLKSPISHFLIACILYGWGDFNAWQTSWIFTVIAAVWLYQRLPKGLEAVQCPGSARSSHNQVLSYVPSMLSRSKGPWGHVLALISHRRRLCWACS